MEIKYGPDGLIPTIVQDWRTNEVLMMAYSNKESLEKTIESGDVHFFSRSRSELWHKGDTSGNYMKVVSIKTDCDYDTLLITAKPEGPACHTGAKNCFFNEIYAKEGSQFNSAMLFELYDVILSRKENPVEGSYTNYLFDSGIDKILKKVGEESAETIIGAKNNSKDEVVYEASDLLYHLGVLLAHMGIGFEDIFESLRLRRTT